MVKNEYGDVEGISSVPCSHRILLRRVCLPLHNVTIGTSTPTTDIDWNHGHWIEPTGGSLTSQSTRSSRINPRSRAYLRS
jgi:hypothetical protein